MSPVPAAGASLQWTHAYGTHSHAGVSPTVASSIIFSTIREQLNQQKETPPSYPLFTTHSTVMSGPTTLPHSKASTSSTTGKTAADRSDTRSPSSVQEKHEHGSKDGSLIRRVNNDTSTSASGSASGNSTTNGEGQGHDKSHGSNTILRSVAPAIAFGAVFCTVGGCYGCWKCHENYHRQQRIFESMLNPNFNQAATPLQSLPPYVHHGEPHPNSHGCSGPPSTLFSTTIISLGPACS